MLVKKEFTSRQIYSSANIKRPWVKYLQSEEYNRAMKSYEDFPFGKRKTHHFFFPLNVKCILLPDFAARLFHYKEENLSYS